MVNQNRLIEVLQEKMRTASLAQRSGVHKSAISRAVNNHRGLSPEASQQVGEVLGVDPNALFISTQVAAKVAQVDAGEIYAGDALASLSRVMVKVAEMHEEGQLPATPELTEAIELLGKTIRELSGEAGASVKSYVAPQETYADGLAAEGLSRRGGHSCRRSAALCRC